MDLFEIKYSLLVKEWEKVQDAIGRFDNIVLIIRGWGVTLTTAAIGYAYTKGDSWVALYAMLPITLLWFNDALINTFQQVFITRAREIEGYLSSGEFERDHEGRRAPQFAIPSLSSRFGTGAPLADKFKRVLRSAFKYNVAAIYGSLIVFCCISYLLTLARP